MVGRRPGRARERRRTREFQAEIQAGSEFRIGPPRLLFTYPKDDRGLSASRSWKRVLALLPAGKDPTPSITVVLDGLPGGPGRRSSR